MNTTPNDQPRCFICHRSLVLDAEGCWVCAQRCEDLDVYDDDDDDQPVPLWDAGASYEEEQSR